MTAEILSFETGCLPIITTTNRRWSLTLKVMKVRSISARAGASAKVDLHKFPFSRSPTNISFSSRKRASCVWNWRQTIS